MRFIKRSLDCLRPGGVAVHFTEFNLSSDDRPLDHAGTVLFRRRDIVALARGLMAVGYEVAPIKLDAGDERPDRYVDSPSYDPETHLKLELDRYVTTPFGIIVRKRGGEPVGAAGLPRAAFPCGRAIDRSTSPACPPTRSPAHHGFASVPIRALVEPLLYHRQVTVLEIVAARALLEAVGTFLAYAVLSALLIGVGPILPPQRPSYLIAALALLIWYSWGHALIITSISFENRAVERLVGPYSYFMIPLSASFFQVAWVPDRIAAGCYGCHLPHVFELARHGQFRSADLRYFDVTTSSGMFGADLGRAAHAADPPRQDAPALMEPCRHSCRPAS